MKLRRAVPVVAMLLVVAGCASPAVEPPGLEATPSASPTPSPEPTPSPSPEVEQSDLELGIVFEEVPELAGPELDVYNTVAWYQKEYWRMMTSNVVSPGFDVMASPEIKVMMQGIATQNAEQQLVLGGVFHARIGNVVVDGDSATAWVCDDYREVIGIDPDGTYTSQEVGLKNLASELTLGPTPAGTWRVLSGTSAGEC